MKSIFLSFAPSVMPSEACTRPDPCACARRARPPERTGLECDRVRRIDRERSVPSRQIIAEGTNPSAPNCFGAEDGNPSASNSEEDRYGSAPLSGRKGGAFSRPQHGRRPLDMLLPPSVPERPAQPPTQLAPADDNRCPGFFIRARAGRVQNR